MSKKKYTTTKNTLPKPPVTRLAVIEGDCNGPFKIVTDFCSPKDQTSFRKIFEQWFDDPTTRVWRIESFINYFKDRHPNSICVLYDDYNKITKGKRTPATRAEWESENN